MGLKTKSIFNMNKKGIFFTILVVIILSLFLISYTFFSLAEQRKNIQKRIETMNSFLFSIEEDIQRQLFISGFRTIFLFEKHILEGRGQGANGYIADVNISFQEAFFNGTIEGFIDEEIQLLMTGVTFSNITDNINKKAVKINVEINLLDPIIEITQEDPWNVKIILTTNLTMRDLAGLASWNRTQSIVALIPIEGFEDPIYPLETNDPTKTNIINRTVNATFSSISELLDHEANTYYLNSSEAPSFLDRLEGNIGASNPNGIESLVATKLGSIDEGISIVDHEYFLGNPGLTCSFSLPTWFLIDSNPLHRSLYLCT